MFKDLKEVVAMLPLIDPSMVAIASVGGRPVTKEWIPTVAEVRDIILDAIGQGSLLTWNNPAGRDRRYFAEKALRDGHLWALRSFTLSFVFGNIPRTFREALAFSERFHMSWQETETKPITVLATGTLTDWLKFTAHKGDSAFRPDHREILEKAHGILHQILPEVYK